VLRAIRGADAVIIAPSNPFLSIGPMLAVPAIRRALAARTGPVAAVSPIVGGRAVSGPLARLLRSRRLPVSPVGIAACYRGLVDVLLVDRRDRGCAPALAALGYKTVVADTVFTAPARAAAAARRLVDALELA
jgi:LPPG:FO 2-phospho-L-lactate transferase